MLGAIGSDKTYVACALGMAAVPQLIFRYDTSGFRNLLPSSPLRATMVFTVRSNSAIQVVGTGDSLTSGSAVSAAKETEARDICLK